MFEIFITKEGFFVKEKGKWVPVSAPLSYYLHYFPKFDKGLTVFDFMKILMGYEQEVNSLFMAYSRGFELKPFWDEMNLPPEKTQERSLDTLVFQWSVDVYNEKEFGKPLLSISDSIHISGKIKKEKGVNYGLSFTKMNELKKVRLKTDSSYKAEYYKPSEMWKDKKGKFIPIFNGIKTMTLRDIVGAWLNEISFFGYPESRNEQGEKILHQSENIKNEKTTPIEVLLLKWKKEKIKRLKKKKSTPVNEKRIAKARKEIRYLKEKLKKKSQ